MASSARAPRVVAMCCVLPKDLEVSVGQRKLTMGSGPQPALCSRPLPKQLLMKGPGLLLPRGAVSVTDRCRQSALSPMEGTTSLHTFCCSFLPSMTLQGPAWHSPSSIPGCGHVGPRNHWRPVPAVLCAIPITQGRCPWLSKDARRRRPHCGLSRAR